MSSKLSDGDLQRYYDGELSLRRARQVHAALRESPRDRQRLAALEQMGDLLRESLAERASEADFEGMWQGVEAQIQAPAPPTLGQKLAGWFHGYRLLATASAAAVALAVVVVSATISSPPQSNDCVIESLEVGPGAVSTIFTIDEPEDQGEITVIWVTDDSTEGGT